MLVVPETLVIWHRDADVLLDGELTQLAMITMSLPIPFWADNAAIVDFVAALALDFCLRFAYDALTLHIL